MKSESTDYSIDLSKAEKVINFRINLLVLLCSPKWIPLVFTIAFVIPSLFHAYTSINKNGITDTIIMLLWLLLLYLCFLWFMFFRNIPFFYNKNLTLAIFEDRFVYIAGKQNVAFARENAILTKNVLNTLILGTDRFHVYIDANVISFDELKSYIKYKA